MSKESIAPVKNKTLNSFKSVFKHTAIELALLPPVLILLIILGNLFNQEDMATTDNNPDTSEIESEEISSDTPKEIIEEAKESPSRMIKCYEYRSEPCADMSPDDIQKENQAVSIYKKISQNEADNGNLIATSNRYQLIQIDYTWKSNFVIIDLVEEKIADELLVSYDEKIELDNGLLFIESEEDQEWAIRYFPGNPSFEKVADTQIIKPNTYRKFVKPDLVVGALSPIGVLATTSNSVNLGIYTEQTLDDDIWERIDTDNMEKVEPIMFERVGSTTIYLTD